jgi:hypothetical protein
MWLMTVHGRRNSFLRQVHLYLDLLDLILGREDGGTD